MGWTFPTGERDNYAVLSKAVLKSSVGCDALSRDIAALGGTKNSLPPYITTK